MEEPERFFKAVRTKLPLSLPYFDGWLMSNPRTLDPCLTFGPNLEVLSPEDLMIERIMRNTEEGFRDACLLMRTATSHLDLEHFQERLIEIVRVTPTVYLGELG